MKTIVAGALIEFALFVAEQPSVVDLSLSSRTNELTRHLKKFAEAKGLALNENDTNWFLKMTAKPDKLADATTGELTGELGNRLQNLADMLIEVLDA